MITKESGRRRPLRGHEIYERRSICLACAGWLRIAQVASTPPAVPPPLPPQPTATAVPPSIQHAVQHDLSPIVRGMRGPTDAAERLVWGWHRLLSRKICTVRFLASRQQADERHMQLSAMQVCSVSWIAEE